MLDGQTARLTQAALETLAVIAYRQPVTRGQVSAVRGVNVESVVRTLAARGLVHEVGTEPSGAVLYATTPYFLERMGLTSLDELPPLAPYLPELAQLDLDERTRAMTGSEPEGIRLQKVLAGAGLGSRRACEALIAAGRVEVDGVVVREQGVRVDPRRWCCTSTACACSSTRTRSPSRCTSRAAWSPRCTTRERAPGPVAGGDRQAAVPRRSARRDSEGLLLLTNDGELAHRLSHPSHEVAKTYVVTVRDA